MAIETYCTAQVTMEPARTAPAGAPGAACITPDDCTVDICAQIDAFAFCTMECASAADCPSDVPRCADAGGIRVCAPASDVGGPIGECVARMESELDGATSSRCLPEYDALTTCLAAGARFCSAADEDVACGVERGRYQACRMAI